MIKQLTAVIAATTLMAGAANAAPISFADFAAGNEGGIVNNTSIDFGGVNISFRSGSFVAADTVDPQFNPYFDDVTGNPARPAGLGVCRVLDGDGGVGDTGAECANSGDDSIDGDDGVREAIQVFFDDGPFNLLGLSFRDGQHNPINNSDGLIEWAFLISGDIVSGVSSFAELVTMAAAGDFVGTSAFQLSYVNTEFYLESISDVPIPGALPLLISGLAGLGFASRKKKKAA